MNGDVAREQVHPEISVAFLLPSPPSYPIGGNKVIYEYANRLSRIGYSVTVCHVLNFSLPKLWRRGYSWIKTIWWRGRRLKKRIGWFQFDPSVKVVCLRDARPSTLPSAGVWVATALETAPKVAEKIQQDKGIGYYFIQGFENWNSSDEQVYASWRLPLVKVAISRWLSGLVEAAGEKCCNIPNGIDFKEFWQEASMLERNPLSIGMGWHDMELKGTRVGIEALSIVKSKLPQLQLKFFGTKRPDAMPWKDAEFYENPTREQLRELYNSCAIFIAPSFSEGWGLTPCEAMACGCCVVATDIGGHREFCIPEETAFMVPPRDPKALAAAVERLLEDDELRCAVATNGHRNIQKFTWEHSVSMLDGLFKKSLGNDDTEVSAPQSRL